MLLQGFVSLVVILRFITKLNGGCMIIIHIHGDGCMSLHVHMKQNMRLL